MRVVTWVFLLFAQMLVAQQGRNFSMWQESSLQFNPGAVGHLDGNMRLFANYRNQYMTLSSTPLQTFSFSFESKLIGTKNKNNYFNTGIIVMNDISGDGSYTVTQVGVPLSYSVKLDERSRLALGVYSGLYQRSIQGNSFTWDHQWNGQFFDTDIFPGEVINNANIGTFDLSAGLMYSYTFDKTRRFSSGYSLQHILSPDLAFNIEDRLMLRHNLHFNANYKIDGELIGLSPALLVMLQGPNQNVMAGTNLDFFLRAPSLRTMFFEPTIFSVGLHYRLEDAVIINSYFMTKGWKIGVSYDTTLSRLSKFNNTFGGVEIFLSYLIDTKRQRKYLR
ncbi:MAG: PorP/SprF family type IX secretion system membrane protein [Crocinitomicaceae bacterium]|nr:PorP/SprF family type IX secretion system membrane protein [Crocinitomicaceae bacterium]